MKSFYNGHFLSEHDIALSAADRGWLYGDGFFTTVKAVRTTLLHFHEHFQRMTKTATMLGIPLIYDERTLRQHCQELLTINQLTSTLASLRITISRGVATERGITIVPNGKPTIMIAVTEYHEPTNYYPRACLSAIRRNEHSPLSYHKTLNYLEPILARQEAQRRGFNEGIFLNTQGMLTESTVANLFLVHNKTVITPKLEDGILPGIMRNVVIQICQQQDIPVIQQSIHPDHIQQASEAFLTNSLLEIQSLACIENHSLLHGEAAIITHHIKTAYHTLKASLVDADFSQQSKGTKHQ